MNSYINQIRYIPIRFRSFRFKKESSNDQIKKDKPLIIINPSYKVLHIINKDVIRYKEPDHYYNRHTE